MSATDFPPIEDLIPHRGSLLLLDRVQAFSDEDVLADYCPRADLWYADHEGAMPAWMGIELMAQAIAAHVALSKRKKNIAPRMGVLLGTRNFTTSQASFAANRPLQIHAKLIFQDALSGLGAYDCAINHAEERLASAVLKVYEPEDFDRFVEGSRS